jgi:hypothetical protein
LNQALSAALFVLLFFLYLIVEVFLAIGLIVSALARLMIWAVKNALKR